MKIAILGLPQSGKKTLFTLLTQRQIPPGRKPGEAVEGAASIRDSRVSDLARICKPRKTTFAENTFVLCPDAVTDGTNRDWLNAARRCDLLCLVARSFASDAVYHPAGTVDAARDLAALRAELLLADMELVDKRLTRLAKEKRAGQSAAQAREEQVLGRCMAALEAGTPLSAAGLGDADQPVICNLEFVSLIPQLAVYNVSESDLMREAPAGSLCVSCLIEQEIAAIADAGERTEYLQAMGLREAGLDRMNAAAYAALGLMSFYTQGEDEVRAWTIRRGATAPVAGGRIHSDIERGFIRVEVIKFDDFVAAGSEKAAKESGKCHTKGRDYAIEDGDICHFLFNV